jgi:predicted transcriptional regulator of viral defense system
MVQKLNRLEVEEKLKSLGLAVFTPKELRGIFGVSENTASAFLSSNVASGLFLKLRNGFYVLKDSHPSHYLIANKLYQPSYVSLEYALSHYGIIPETVYGVTSVTTKATREFETPVGSFSYQRIKQGAFTGYTLRQIHGEKVLIAEAEKALADYLYFVDLKKVSLNDRLELKNISRKKLAGYVKMFDRDSLLKLTDHVYAEYRKPRKIY